MGNSSSDSQSPRHIMEQYCLTLRFTVALKSMEKPNSQLLLFLPQTFFFHSIHDAAWPHLSCGEAIHQVRQEEHGAGVMNDAKGAAAPTASYIQFGLGSLALR